MEITEAKKMCLELLKEHDLNVNFKFDNAVRRFGRYNEFRNIISLSKNLVLLNNEKIVRNTMLHEIAHALVGSKNKHNHIWKNKAIEIGCDGKRCYSDDVIIPKSNYIYKCFNCGNKFRRFRRTEGYCGICVKKNKGVLSDEYLIKEYCEK